LDADGQMTAVTFRGGKAHIRTRMIETRAYVEERAAGRHLWRGQFGTKKQARPKQQEKEQEKVAEPFGGSSEKGGGGGGFSFAHLVPNPLVRRESRAQGAGGDRSF
jgi:hypothetical protein